MTPNKIKNLVDAIRNKERTSSFEADFFADVCEFLLSEIERLKKRVEELEKENEVLREQNSLYHAKFKELEIAYRRAKRKILKSRAEEAEKKS